MQRPFRSPVLLALAALLLVAGAALPLPSFGAEGAAPRARVIVKFKPEAGAQSSERAAERLDRAATRHGAAPRAQRPLGGEVRLLTADGVDSATLARRLAAEPDVAYAVPDRRMRPAAMPNDPLYAFQGDGDPAAGQWYLRPPDGLFRSAIDAETAWTTAVTTASATVVVAVFDTGVRFDHPDLKTVAAGGKLLPGYDFVRDPDIAGDGGGRDADASDPGDWLTVEEVQRSRNDNLREECVRDPFTGDLVDTRSSWHGTKVAGMLGALTNNAIGIAGAGWGVKLLPVRVLGKCGGFESDIVVGMRWAAGMSIEGVPNLPADQRARVLNLSLGGAGECGAAYADAVTDVRALGVAVVASAGNTAGHEVSAPANCPGVIGVGGLRHIGTKVGFSDLGPEVAISAPGGNCVNTASNEPCLYPLVTTTNAGITTPVAASAAYTDGSSDFTVGTSFSAPLVSATAALMLAVQPGLTPDELAALLQSSATPFPTGGADPGIPQCTAPRFGAGGRPIDQLECYCTTETCGAGMLNAAAAVAQAGGTVVRISLVGADDPRADQPVTLTVDDSLLAGGRSIASVRWTLVDDGGIVGGFEPVQGGGDPSQQPSVTLTPTDGGSFTVQAEVSDGTANPPSVQTVRVAVAGEPRNEGGGGGGALGAPWLLALAVACAAARSATRVRPRRGSRAPRPSVPH